MKNDSLSDDSQGLNHGCANHDVDGFKQIAKEVEAGVGGGNVLVVSHSMTTVPLCILNPEIVLDPRLVAKCGKSYPRGMDTLSRPSR